MCFRSTQHSVGGMERGVYWHQNEEQRDKRERKQVKMKGEKGNENEVWFLKDRNIPSLTINLDKPSNPCL